MIKNAITNQLASIQLVSTPKIRNIFAVMATVFLFAAFMLIGMVLTTHMAGTVKAANGIFEQDGETIYPLDVAVTVDSLIKLDEGAPPLIEVKFNAIEDVYLYEHEFVFNLDKVEISEVFLPPSTPKSDEFFGDYFVHYDTSIISLQLEELPTEPFTLQVDYLACTELGYCYPPAEAVFEYDPTTGHTTVLKAGGLAGFMLDLLEPAGLETSSVDNLNQDYSEMSVSEQSRVTSILTDKSLFLILLAFFGFGLLLTFTPCVLPMIPIVSSIVIGQGSDVTKKRAFCISLSYVLGMGLTYTTIGVIAGLMGASLQLLMQTPWIIGLFAFVFVLLSLSMFGFYELALPRAWTSRVNSAIDKQSGKLLWGTFIVGCLSALVLSPCVTAPLIGALTFISQSGDAVVGGLALFAMSLGMGAPLILVATFGSQYLPKAGAWMNYVKAIFGVGLLAVAILLLERLWQGPMILALWGALAVLTAWIMGLSELFNSSTKTDDSHSSIKKSLIQAIWIVVFLWGVIMLIGAGLGNRDWQKPLASLSFNPSSSISNEVGELLKPVAINNLDELVQETNNAVANNQLTILDFYADWCLYCQIYKDRIFPSAEVQERLNEFSWLKADVTKVSQEHRALMEHFGVFAPPAIIFIDSNGNEIIEARIVGELSKEEFVMHLDNVLEFAR